MGPEERLRTVLDVWVGIWRLDPELHRFTHVRADFGRSENPQWHALRADDNTIYESKSVTIGDFSQEAIRLLVKPYWVEGGERGQLTFRFNPPAVMLDIFDGQNNPLVAEHIIDEGRLC